MMKWNTMLNKIYGSSRRGKVGVGCKVYRTSDTKPPSFTGRHACDLIELSSPLVMLLTIIFLHFGGEKTRCSPEAV